MGHLVYDDKMWILGGFEPGRVNDVWSSSDGEIWECVTSAAEWPPRNLPTCLVYDGKMWLMGGSDQIQRKSVTYNDVWNSTDGQNWNLVTPNAAWSARSAASSLVFNGKMWIFGGMDAPWRGAPGARPPGLSSMGKYGRAHNHDVWYSTDGIGWEQAADYAPWSDRAMHSSVVFDNKMWVIGGGVYDESYYRNTVVNYNDVWFSTDGENWTEATGHAGWPARRFHRSVVYEDKMWVIGGNNYGNRNDTWYSSDGEHWSRLKSDQLWSVRHEPACLVYRDKLWLLGGFGQELYNDIWTLTTSREQNR